ncbi:hypothetical protein FHL15_006017 [Xylaria flabelliformis]|uniref:Uncharacterized protein n=1 Tax=Xylaria flabelliformis TaxID=2512241 RepID=A0A553HYX2_9PEZI|nr:hypothetical protein FHL15_006017 [Xylaria flabelliformis]
MAPREKSQLKRARDSPNYQDSDLAKKPRRSERLSQKPDAASERGADKGAGKLKTPIIKNQLPSPVTHLTDNSNEVYKEPTAEPPEGRPSQVTHRTPEETFSQAQHLSSPPQDTQAFPTSQYVDPNGALSDEVEDEVKEGVWGYLFPLDPRYGGRCVVLKKRSMCPKSSDIDGAVDSEDRKKCALEKEEIYEKTKTKGGVPSGGYLIGRHPECDVIIDDPIVSNRHCLLFTENKGEDAVAIVEDLSSNGTFVNEAIVGRNQRRELQEQDEIAVMDKARFIFRYPRSRSSSAFLQQYTLLERLGKGHFAEVFLCVEKSTGHRYAVKIFTKHPGMEERSKMDGLQQEIAVLMGVSHPNVLCLKDTFNEKNAVYLVLELAPEGELFNHIVTKQKLSEDETRKLFSQLFQDKDVHVKLADFGLAKIIGEESFTTTLCGTPSYVAPEILAEGRHRKYTKAVDVWSLGVVLYICLCGFPPFSDELYSREFPYTLSQQIKSGRFDYPSPYWDSVGDPAPDSTNGLVDGIGGLDMNRRGVVRERTLLSSINSVHVTRKVPLGPNSKQPLKIYEKNPTAKGKTGPAEARPDDQRAPEEFAQMGGKGDQQLFGDDDNTFYSVSEATAAKGGKPKREKGKASGR